MRKLAFAAFVTALLSLPMASCAAQPSSSDRAFGEKVRAYLLEHPEVVAEAMTALQAKQDLQAAEAARTAIADNRAKIERDERDPVVGPAGARITVTQFFDYRCPYCKVAGGQIQAFIAKHPDVRFVFKEFPILSEASTKAAKLALAADKQGKYLKVHTALLAAPTLDDAIIDDVLKGAGVDIARAKADAAGPAITSQVEANQALARTLGVNGTPSFIVGERVSNGWAPEELDAEIAAEQKKAKRG